MALGAEQLEVAKLVVRQVGVLAGIGLVLGVAVALLVMRFGLALLFEVGYADPITYGIAVAGMAAVVTVAAFLPARNAARLDPAESLRVE